MRQGIYIESFRCISIIIRMSVDLFGRKLGRTQGSRGPPGIGYKLTIDGQFDLENKKLCNLAAPNQPNDAVNLATVHSIVQTEVHHVLNITSQLRSDLDNFDEIVDTHRDEIDKKWMELKSEIRTVKEMISQMNENIHSIDAMMQTLKNRASVTGETNWT